MIHDCDLSRQASLVRPLTCPRCHARLVLEDIQPSAPLTDQVAHALIDHLLLIETELAAIRRLLVEEVLP